MPSDLFLANLYSFCREQEKGWLFTKSGIIEQLSYYHDIEGLHCKQKLGPSLSSMTIAQRGGNNGDLGICRPCT